MELTPTQYYERVLAHVGPDGRLGPQETAAWTTFPYEPENLRVRVFDPPVVPEPERRGVAAADCSTCSSWDRGIWRNERFRVSLMDPSGVPVEVLLTIREHVDFTELGDGDAAEQGQLLVHLARLVEHLPHVARAHVDRWGDGSYHSHVFVSGRPEGQLQLRGTLGVLWWDILPAVPAELAAGYARTLARGLCERFGGEVLIEDDGDPDGAHR